MQTPADAALASLDAVERGFVLGALLLGAAEDAGLTAPLLPPSRERCAAALAALAALPRAERIRLTGAMARDAMAPLPAGIEAVHPEQLAAALAGESPATVALVARGAPRALRAALLEAGGGQPDPEATGDALASALESGALDPSMVTELQRAALAPIVALPPRGDGPSERPALAMAHLGTPALLVEAAEGGAAALGRRLSNAEGDGLGTAELLLALAQRLPPNLGRALLEAATARRAEHGTGARAGEAPGRQGRQERQEERGEPKGSIRGRAKRQDARDARDARKNEEN